MFVSCDAEMEVLGPELGGKGTMGLVEGFAAKCNDRRGVSFLVSLASSVRSITTWKCCQSLSMLDGLLMSQVVPNDVELKACDRLCLVAGVKLQECSRMPLTSLGPDLVANRGTSMRTKVNECPRRVYSKPRNAYPPPA